MTKTILVTGASAGFGAAIVERFAGAGWRVVATGRRVDRLQQLVERFGADVVHPAAFDIRDADAMQAAPDAIPAPFRSLDRTSDVSGKRVAVRVGPGCGRIVKKKK